MTKEPNDAHGDEEPIGTWREDPYVDHDIDDRLQRDAERALEGSMSEQKTITITPSAPTATELSGQAAMMSVIEKAARDPSVDVTKMERLFAMYEAMQARAAEKAYFEAMTEAQIKMRSIAPDAENTQTHSRYATYAAIDKAIRPIYSAAGFALSFNTEPGDGAKINVICKVSHIGGHSERHSILMPADGKGAKGGDVMTLTHATGSAVQYGMRYLVKMIFNVAIGEDDDGNGAGGDDDKDKLFLDVITEALKVAKTAEDFKEIKAKINAQDLSQAKKNQAVVAFNLRLREISRPGPAP